MTRKALDAFKPETLAPGKTKYFTVVNPKTHFHECHYYHRDYDGELFYVLTKIQEHGLRELREWLKLKKAQPSQLKQLDFTITESVR